MRLVVLLVVLVSSTAHADHQDTFAKAFSVTRAQVHEVRSFELPPGNDATHVVIGRFDHNKYVMTGAVIMRCSATECTWRRSEFGAADTVEVSGVVDLHGAPTAIPDRNIVNSGNTKIPGVRGMKFPVLVVRTRESKQATGETRSRKKVEGTETRAKLYLISLVDSDRGSVILMDTSEERSPTGRGFTRSYRLDNGDTKGSLDVIAREQRRIDNDSRCLRPAPTEAVYALEDRHYRTKSYTPGKGC